jgi:UDP-3-O-[3-hydroxymyristoyl] glucosamine N-acyltransferase
MKLGQLLSDIGPYDAINFSHERDFIRVWNPKEAGAASITFISGPTDTKAGAIVTTDPDLVIEPLESQTIIIHPRPRWAAARIAEWFHQPLILAPEPYHVYHVVTYNGVTWGANFVCGPGTILGYDGFGFEHDEHGYFKMPHLGGVVIGNNVELQANVCVDRGVFSNTTIGDGTKVDNFCHIAHNCQIGRNVMFTAGVILGGSVTIEDNVWVGLNATIMQGVTIGANATIGIGAVVLRDVEPDQTIVGHHRVIETKSTQPGVVR